MLLRAVREDIPTVLLGGLVPAPATEASFPKVGLIFARRNLRSAAQFDGRFAVERDGTIPALVLNPHEGIASMKQPGSQP